MYKNFLQSRDPLPLYGNGICLRVAASLRVAINYLCMGISKSVAITYLCMSICKNAAIICPTIKISESVANTPLQELLPEIGEVLTST
jgi:hypothetical protein